MTVWPVDGEVSQPYGSNPTAALPADSWLIQTFGNYQPNGHTGVDFPVPVGTPVRAAATGVVKHVGWYAGSYLDNPYWISPSFAGFCLVIDHGSFVGIYAHLSDASVQVGHRVTEGQVVARSGNTGGSTGPHLHFEVLPDGWDFNNGMYGRVNPARYITGKPSIVPQSTTTPKPAEGFLMALTDAQQKLIYDRLEKYVDSPISLVPERTWNETVLRGGKRISVKQELADAKTEAQALRAALVAMSKNPSLTPDQITAAVKAGIADGTVTVDVNVNGAAA